MGYQAITTDSGPDRGIDIVAHPDALGFEKPLIKVQVKHLESTTGGPDMRSFIGTLRSGESGLCPRVVSRTTPQRKQSTPTSPSRFSIATGLSNSCWSTTTTWNRSIQPRFPYGVYGCRSSRSRRFTRTGRHVVEVTSCGCRRIFRLPRGCVWRLPRSDESIHHSIDDLPVRMAFEV